MKLEAGYIRDLLTCGSNKDESGESLAPVLNLMDHLGDEGLQETLDFLFLFEDPVGDQEPAYPLLELATNTMTRGLHLNESTHLSLAYQQRFNLSQEVLSGLDLHTLGHLAIQWNHEGTLSDLLETIGSMSSRLQDGTMEGAFANLLQDQEIRDHLLNVLFGFLNTPEFYPLISQQLVMEPSVASLRADYLPCAMQDLEPRLPSWPSPDQSCLKVTSPGAPLPSGKDHLVDFWQGLTSQDQEAILEGVKQFTHAIVEDQSDDRFLMINRLVEGAKHLILSQKDAARHITAVIDAANQSKADDFSEFMEGLEKIASMESFFGTIREKVGSAILRDNIEGLILQGGSVLGCNGLFIPGLADAEDQIEVFQRYLTPHPSCGQVPPILSMTLATLIPECKAGACEAMEILLDKLTPPQVPNQLAQGVLTEVTQEAIRHATYKLSIDPYSLYHQNLAYDQISASRFSKLMNQLPIPAHLTPKSLVDLDRFLSSEAPYRDTFRERFLENLVIKYLEYAVSRSNQISGFFREPSSLQNHIIHRATRGLYPEGPIGRILDANLSPSSIKSQLPDFPMVSERDHLGLSRMLSRIRQPELVFKNKPFDKKQDQNLTDPVYGSQDPMSFTFESGGSITPPRTTALKFKALFLNGETQKDDPADHYGLWSRYVDSGPIRGLYASMNNEDAFMTWATESLFPFLEKLPENSTLSPSPRLEPLEAILQKTPYSLAQKRSLAYFYVRNYLGIVTPSLKPYKLKNRRSISGEGQYPVFSNENFFLQSNLAWQGFRSSLPVNLFAGDSWDELGANLLPETYAEYQASIEDMKQSSFSKNGITIQQYDALPSAIKRLFGLNLIASKAPPRKRRKNLHFIQPLIGIHEESCFNDDLSDLSCPLELRTENVQKTYQTYRATVQDVFRGSFCLLLNQEVFDGKFIADITETLKLDPMWCAQNFEGQDPALFMNPFQTGYPPYATQQVIEDILAAGTLQGIHPELQNLAQNIAVERLRSPDLHPSQRAESLLATNIAFPNRHLTFHRKRQLDYQDFMLVAPGIVNTSLNFLADVLPENQLRETFRAIGAESMGPDGSVSKMINLIIKIQGEHATRGSTTLHFALDTFHQIWSDPDLKRTAIHIIAYPTDFEIGDLWAFELPAAFNDLFMDETGTNTFKWQNEGHHLLKQLLQREFFLSLQKLLQSQNPARLTKFITIFHDSLQTLGSTEQQAKTVQNVLNFLTKYAYSTLTDTQSLVIHTFSQTLAKLSKIGLPQSWWPSLHKVLNWTNEPNQGFKDQPTPPVLTALIPLLRFGLDSKFELFELYQYSKAPIQQQPEFLKALALGLTEPLYQSPSPKFIYDILQGTIGKVGIDRISLFAQSSFERQKLTSLLKALSIVPADLWLENLALLQEVAPESADQLNWLRDQIIWNPKASPSYTYVLNQGTYLIQPEHDLLQRQLSLIRGWIKGSPPKGAKL